ncbi:MAG TPA: HWE histidine kinase domain-containing protein [Propylenella sp.]|nr:HWE histidine kinase domain-containing protein [Propylenella sp.]
MALRAPAPPIADVFITEELDLRAPKAPDHLREKRALQDLAARMADHPEEVLPRFVDLAMEMTGAVSAGLSLYEGDEAGTFRWRYLRGILAPFEGAATPRNFSPCGITLDRNAPVLSAHPERVYDWISDADIVVPEVLLVPLYLGGTDPMGTLWIVSDREGLFDSGHARALTELASFVGAALSILQTQQSLQRALQEQERLTAEMNHRIKNLFAITDSIIRISARSTSSKDEMTKVLSGRLHALANAHALVRRSSPNAEVADAATDLAELIRTIVAPHESSGASRFSMEGPVIPCSDKAVDHLALVFHELATNAVKYGALNGDDGRVDVQWQQEDGRLLLRWVERGGPPVFEPSNKGYGSKLVAATVTGQFGGSLDYAWNRDGLAVTITAPVARLLN